MFLNRNLLEIRVLKTNRAINQHRDNAICADNLIRSANAASPVHHVKFNYNFLYVSTYHVFTIRIRENNMYNHNHLAKYKIFKLIPSTCR